MSVKEREEIGLACVCMCVCVREREREKEREVGRESDKESLCERLRKIVYVCECV